MLPLRLSSLVWLLLPAPAWRFSWRGAHALQANAAVSQVRAYSRSAERWLPIIVIGLENGIRYANHGGARGAAVQKLRCSRQARDSSAVAGFDAAIWYISSAIRHHRLRRAVGVPGRGKRWLAREMSRVAMQLVESIFWQPQASGTSLNDMRAGLRAKSDV